MKTLNDLLQASVMAINESGLEPNVAVDKPVQALDLEDRLVDIDRVVWDADNDCFVVVVL